MQSSFFRLWSSSLVIKFLLAAILPLAADEAYYWIWSHHLQLSYFDHPPMIAYLLKLSQFSENWGYLIRWPIVLLGHATIVIWYFILKPDFNNKQILWWLILILACPLTGIGSILATPDVPLLFFWSLSLFLFKKALVNPNPLLYALLGFSLGLGFCSKYHIVLFILFLILQFFLDLSLLKKIRYRLIPITLLSGLITCFPVLLWNYQNDWISFKFQIDHGLGKNPWNPEWTISYILSFLLFLGPLYLLPLIKAAKQRSHIFYSSQLISQFLFFLYSSFKSVVEANWPLLAYPGGFALIVSQPVKRKFTIITATFWFVVTCLLLSHWLIPWLPADDRRDETHQYRSLIKFTKNYSPLYANTYQMASIMTFESKINIPKLRDMSRYDFFDTLQDSIPDQKVFFLLLREGQEVPDWVKLQPHKIELVEKSSPNFELVRISLL